MSKNVLLTISYDGTDFCGWQRQDSDDKKQKCRTVQQSIENALEKIHKTHVDLHGSGRTDSGVHAYAQAANFIAPFDSIPVKNYVQAINALLPHDVRIIDAVEKPEDFHARFSATKRTYRYFIDCTSSPYAHEMRYVLPIFRVPNIDRLNDMAQCLDKEIDCTTFSAVGDKSLSKYRYLYTARFFWGTLDGKELGCDLTPPPNSKLVFEIAANAFLWKMVRSITGSLIYFERKNWTKDDFQKLLDSKDRTKVGPTAPPTGLFLWDVSFDGERVHK